MEDKVYINIKGLQFSAQDDEEQDDEAIEIINIGKYKIVNGKEYIKYDEIYEDDNQKSSNLIKISDGNVELTKRGAVTAHMSFVTGEKTMTFYNTPYGSIYLGIFSRSIDIERSEDRIKVFIDYSIEMNYEQVSDCKVEMEIISKSKFSLES